eukprot:COSAG05_NODE_2468_length_3027_cov_1.333675_3_plen_182_part_00
MRRYLVKQDTQEDDVILARKRGVAPTADSTPSKRLRSSGGSDGAARLTISSRTPAASGALPDSPRPPPPPRKGRTMKPAAKTSSSVPAEATAKAKLLLPPSEREMKVLRDFDLRGKYGAVAGISRLVRWRRAERMGMRPSPEVGEILTRHSRDVQVMTSVFDAPLSSPRVVLKSHISGADE